MTATANPLNDIYSPENIARSRERAAAFRRLANTADPATAAEYINAAEQIEQYADERALSVVSHDVVHASEEVVVAGGPWDFDRGPLHRLGLEAEV